MINLMTANVNTFFNFNIFFGEAGKILISSCFETWLTTGSLRLTVFWEIQERLTNPVSVLLAFHACYKCDLIQIKPAHSHHRRLWCYNRRSYIAQSAVSFPDDKILWYNFMSDFLWWTRVRFALFCISGQVRDWTARWQRILTAESGIQVVGYPWQLYYNP